MARYQRSISNSFTVEGIGLHKGKTCQVSLHPAPVNTGIQLSFHGEERHMLSPALLCHHQLCTGLRLGSKIIYTTEHLLATLFGLHIDNVFIQVNSNEIPILDGSALEWVKMIQPSICQQPSSIENHTVSRPVTLRNGQSTLQVRPSSVLQISASIDFSHPLIGQQCDHYHHNQDNFLHLSQARTFGFLNDHQKLLDSGYALGASQNNCIILTSTGLLDKQQLRFPQEMLHHKILDFLGDLAVLNLPFTGNFILHRPSHSLNQHFVKLLIDDKELLTNSKNSIYYS